MRGSIFLINDRWKRSYSFFADDFGIPASYSSGLNSSITWINLVASKSSWKNFGRLRNLKEEIKETTIGQTLSNYIALTKPGILVLLVLEAMTAMIVAAGRSTTFQGLLGIAIAGILSSGGSAALNHYLERNKDVLMTRTDQRPVANHKIAPRNALIFGILAIIAGLVIADLLFNVLTALMISLGSISYIFLYTLYLKPRTYWNIVIGGVAGVFPALAGWAAVTDRIGWPSLFIGILVFLWTPPHFWGLSLKFKDDYVRSGYPMLSVVKQEREVINWIVLSTIPLLIFSFLPLAIRALGAFDPLYYSIASIMAVAFVIVDYRMLKNPTVETGFNAFLISLPYLFLLFAGMIISSLI
jgi:heme o synthase